MDEIKVVGIAGSPHRNGKNFQLLAHSLEGCAENGAKVEIINLSDYNISSCVGCKKCKNKSGVCHYFDDDMDSLVVPKLVDCDAIILSSPVYYGNISSLLSTFIERTVPLRRADYKLANKVGGIVVVGNRRNGGHEAAIKMGWEFFIRNNMLFIGGDEDCPYGPSGWGMGKEEVYSDELSIKSAKKYGRRITEIVRKMKTGFIINKLSYSYSREGTRRELELHLRGENTSGLRDNLTYNSLQNKIRVLGVCASKLKLPHLLIDDALSAASGAGADVKLFEASHSRDIIPEIMRSNAVIMASDSFYGGYNPDFVNLFRECEDEYFGSDYKLFTAISSATSRQGGQENVIKQLWEFAIRKGMILIGGSSGAQYGVLGWENNNFYDFHARQCASFLGRKITKLADILSS